MYYKRSAWTNKPNNSVSFKVPQTSITWHYPGFGNSSIKTAGWSLQKCFNQYSTWEKQHQARGSKNIEYNFGVTPTGDVVELRGFRQSGANGNSAANRASISVQVLIGDTEPLNSKFLKGIADAISLIRRNQPNAINKFYPHQHWVSTACPGQSIVNALRNGTINKNMSGSISVPSGGTSVPKPSTNVWDNSPRIKGMSKETVKEIQTKLVKAGFSVGSYGVDGSYKAGTTKAVKEFQKKHGLTVDGVAGPNTIAKLDAVVKGSSKPTPAPVKPVTKPLSNVWDNSPRIKGMSKATVKSIQNKLIKAGYSVGSYGADGSYKSDTVAAVKAFQKNNGLTVDGVAGPTTVSKLDAVVKSSEKPSKPEVTKAPSFPLPKGYVYGKSSGPITYVSGRGVNSKAPKDVVKDSNGRWYSKGLKQWQAQMKKRGWTISVDGRYGTQTEKVAKQFKKNYKLGNDGRIGPVTWAAAWNLKVT